MALPTGGGAIRGIGEKFGVDAVTGTASLSVPLPASPGRGGVGPALSLAYDSGAGNGAFGFGWSIGAHAITRKTDKGVPRYLDGEESDVFILAGAEDLVPILDANGTRPQAPTRTVHGVTYSIHRYRPRIDSAFSRIERWVDVATRESHFRVITRDNVTSWFGTDRTSRIYAPDDPTKIYSYLLARTVDDRGHVVEYVYVGDDERGVDLAPAHEANRTTAARQTQRYVKRIRYSYTTPYVASYAEVGPPPPLPDTWLFELVFDYGDHASTAPAPAPDRPWTVRPDPFSTYRAGFEIRTYRRCHRVLAFHHFPGEPAVGNDCLVRALELQYADEAAGGDPHAPIYTFITTITQASFVRNGPSTYLRAAMPSIELEYTAATLSTQVQSLDRASASNLPEGLAAGQQWLDLDGDGCAGVLASAGGAWTYKRNLGPLSAPVAQLGPLETLPAMPSRTDLGARRMLDLVGDGRLSVVDLDGPAPGYFARGWRRDWEPFRAFDSLPRIAWNDPNVRLIDLTGDGRADVLLTEDHLFTFWRSRGPIGFAAPEQVQPPWDEQRGPAVVLADGSETMFLADMTGDGLSDLVRVRNGEVCYWPNLGYGRFGARVAMDGAPRFTDDVRFDPKRVRLTDIDGSGTTDLLYIGEQGVVVCFNQSGNAWSPPRVIAAVPSTAASTTVQVVDLLGNGTACLVWSSPLPADSGAPVRYVDLMGGTKPHLLTRLRNNLGAETRMTYAPSTRFYLADERAGRRWVTRLPHVVHVVERTESYDWVGRSRFVTRRAYHHGYFDAAEREFRGFGMVESWDTEEHREDTSFPIGDNWDATSWAPPVHTRTWLHVGALGASPAISRQHASEYWVESALRPTNRALDRAAMELPDSLVIPPPSGALTARELREALRALKGSVLRTEVYADDGTPRAAIPYTVSESSFEVRCVQPRGPNRHAVFTVHPREHLALQYERADGDPRVTHDVTLEVDAFDNVLRSASIAYPRRAGAILDASLPSNVKQWIAHDQARLHITATRSLFTNDLADPATSPDVHRTPLPAETIAAEMLGFAPGSTRPGVTNLFRFAELDGRWQTAWDGAHDLLSEEVEPSDVDSTGSPAAGVFRRLLSHSQTQYRAADLTALLPLYTLDALALAGQSFQLAVTSALRARAIDPRATDAVFVEGGYLARGGDWWISSNRAYLSPGDADSPATELAYARAHFFGARRTVDVFGKTTRVTLDGYDLLPVSATDAVNNTTSAVNDYRVLHPYLATDANGNQAQVAFDARGNVVGTAVLGKANESGDSLAGFIADLPEATMLAHLADPLTNPDAILGDATTRLVYDVLAYARAGTPPVVYTLARETHVADLAAGQSTRYHHSIAYSDGLGHVAQAKAQAATEAGVARWVASGWTIYNNKGQPVRTYEPFFTLTPAFEFAATVGVSSTVIYDAVGRAVGSLHPDHTWTKVVVGAWRGEAWDASDTAVVTDPRADADVGDALARQLGSGAFTTWYAARSGGALGSDDQDAAAKTAAHAATPSITHLDTLGHTCVSVADNGSRGLLCIHTAFDGAGRSLAVTDALGRRAQEHVIRDSSSGGMRYVRGTDFAGHAVFAVTQDGGARRTLADLAGQPLRIWDARQHAFRFVYDAARRMTQTYVETGGGPEILLELVIFGEGLAAQNLCRRVFRHYDTAGLVSHEAYDYAGNLVTSSRRLATAWSSSPDWTALAGLTDAAALDAAATAAGLLEAETFQAATRWDALGRATQTVTPHSSQMRPNVLRSSYDEGGHLVHLDVWRQRATAPTQLLDPATADLHALTGMTYNARGQRTGLSLGNAVTTAFTYDPLTFRIATIVTTRPAGVVQDIAYAYDASGNITRIHDDAQQSTYFDNAHVDPSTDYTYDAVYRLVTALGREHIGQTGGAQISDDDGPRTNLPQPGDGTAMASYTESYTHDGVGNLLSVVHQVAGGTWTRGYAYAEPSRIAAGELANRLSATSLPTDPAAGPFTGTYAHDEHGNMTRMPHLPALAWDERDRLRSTTRQVVHSGVPEASYYTYDGGGGRVRKLTASAASDLASSRIERERIYLGAVEVYREYDGRGAITLARETLHLDGGGRIALVETRTVGTDKGSAALVRYQHGNHVHSALLELDDHAAIISYEEYFPFGSTAYQSVASQNETPKRYRFTGKERDAESDLEFHGLRYCAPWLGRWTACDPAGMVDGTCAYAYVRNNPIGLSDPSGAQSRRSPAPTRPPSHPQRRHGGHGHPQQGHGAQGHGRAGGGADAAYRENLRRELADMQRRIDQLQADFKQFGQDALSFRHVRWQDFRSASPPPPAPVQPPPAPAPTPAPAAPPETPNLGPIASGYQQGQGQTWRGFSAGFFYGGALFGSGSGGSAQLAAGVTRSDSPVGLEVIAQTNLNSPGSAAIGLHGWHTWGRVTAGAAANVGGAFGPGNNGSVAGSGTVVVEGALGGNVVDGNVVNPRATIGANATVGGQSSQDLTANNVTSRTSGVVNTGGTVNATANFLYGTIAPRIPTLSIFGEFQFSVLAHGTPGAVSTGPGAPPPPVAVHANTETVTVGATANIPLNHQGTAVLMLGAFLGVNTTGTTVTPGGGLTPQEQRATQVNAGGGASFAGHF